MAESEIANEVPMSRMVSVMISVQADTRKLAKAMRLASKIMRRFTIASMSANWEHSRSRGENQQGYFRGMTRVSEKGF